MSFDVFVQCFQDGQPVAALSREAVRELFPVSGPDSDVWDVRYDQRNFTDIYVGAPDDTLIARFMVNRPCKDPRLWDALLTILRMGHVVLYYPDCKGPIVADESVVPHLPASMSEGFGEPRIVTSADQIVEAIRRD
jgi:hypothetical protein